MPPSPAVQQLPLSGMARLYVLSARLFYAAPALR